jgi:hypothetical protein
MPQDVSLLSQVAVTLHETRGLQNKTPKRIMAIDTDTGNVMNSKESDVLTQE